MELPQGGASEHVSKPCPGNLPTEGMLDSRGNCSVFPPAPHPGESFAACILLWEVSFRFIFSVFFFSAAFFSCKSMLRLSSKATALLEFPAHSSREVFSCRISKTLQSQQNLPQSVAKGSTLITQLGAWERDDIDGKETFCLGKLWERGFMTQKEALGERAGQHNRCN